MIWRHRGDDRLVWLSCWSEEVLLSAGFVASFGEEQTEEGSDRGSHRFREKLAVPYPPPPGRDGWLYAARCCDHPQS